MKEAYERVAICLRLSIESLKLRIRRGISRNHKNILHPPDRKNIHGYAPCKCHFLHYRRGENAERLTGGKP